MQYIYAIEYYSAIKKNEIFPFETTWMDLEGILLSEMSGRERQILYVFTYMWNLKKKTNKYNKPKSDSQIQRTD